jgi:tetratricopeptide (TPR) repeat protein
VVIDHAAARSDRRYVAVLLAALLCVLGQSAANARDIHYGAVDDPQLLQCDQQYWHGLVQDSTNCYSEILAGDASAAIKAESAWALNDLQQANRWFQQAMRETPDDVATRTRWGDLYADSHQDAEAMELYTEALELEPNNAFAKLGAARVLAGSFDDAANVFLEPLLSDATTDDGVRVGAWLLVARVALENNNPAEARAAMATAEEIIERRDWPPLELYALRAASDLLQDASESRWTAMSLEYNPHFGNIYAVPAHFYVITRRYRDAIDLYQKAVDIEPGLAAAHEELGVNLLRDNQMSRARKHLEIAHNVDPFSPIAVNTLRLLDSFENFRLVTDPLLPQDSHAVPITLRLHKDESEVIAPYAITLTRDSIKEFTQRYDFELGEGVVIEMYPDHEDFAVRTAGMPGIGILGATFGYVVAMDSPTARPADQFQWGTTLWHEMAHVFTLEASDHLVPRWFSEGVSVFEEWRSGPNPGVRIPMSVYNAMKDDRFLPIAGLDEGFVRPTYEEQVIVSYMQAGLICQFIDQRYGEKKLGELLYAYKDGLQTAAAIETVLEVSTTQFDREFAAFVVTEHGEILDNLEEWHKTQVEISQLIDTADWQGTIAAANRQLELLPLYTEPDSPYLALRLAEDELGNTAAATAALETFWRNGGYDPASLKELGSRFREDGRTNDAIAVLMSGNLVDPFDQELHGMLGELLLDQGRVDEALQEFTVALALDPHDKAIAHYRLATAHHELGDKNQAQNHLLQALDVAPNYRPAQRLLLEMVQVDAAN